MSRTKNTIINTGMGFIVKLTNVLANFVLRTVFIQCLGAEYNGVSSLFTDILTILSFAELGISSAITYELYKPIAEKDEKRIAQLMNFFKWAYRTVALLVLVLGVLLIPFMDFLIVDIPNIKENIVCIYILYLINTVASYLLIYKSTLLIAAQKKYAVSNVEITVSILRTVAQCIFLIIFKEFIAYLLITIIATIIQNVIISRKVDVQYPFLHKYNDKLEKQTVKKLFKDVKALSMYKIATAILGGIDSAIISITTGTIWVGYVANYKLVIKGVDAILYQFYHAIEPSIGNLAVEEDEKQQYHVYKITNMLTFWISCFFGVCFCVLLNPFIELWLGAQYVLSLPIVIVLVLEFYLVMMIRPIASFRTGNGLFVQGQYRPLIMLILNVIFSLLFAIKWGIFGVLLATVVSRLLTQVWYDPYLVYSKVFKVSVINYWKEYLYMLFIAIANVLVTNHIVKLIDFENSVIAFLVKTLICMIVSNIIILIGIGWKPEFKKLFSIVRAQVNTFRRK